MSYSILLKLAQRGRFTARLRELVVAGIALGIYTQQQLDELDGAQSQWQA